jgi:DNA-binding NarL/FixJ family response regulator
MLYQEMDSQAEIPHLFEALALTAVAQGEFQRAVKLWGAAEARRDGVQARLPSSKQADYAPYMDRARSVLGEQAFVAAWAEGRAMTLDQAITLAVAEPAPAAAPSASGKAAPVHPVPVHPVPVHPVPVHQYGLTPREVEVLCLVATGLTDAEVAQRLVISARTVGKHLQSVYSKLYLPSRSAATRWAIEHHMA